VLLDAVAAAVAGGVDVVQVRNRAASPAELVDLVRAVRHRIGQNALLLVNGPPDIALSSDADGVHLPELVINPAVARQRLGNGRHVGVSVHSLESAIRAERLGADSLTFGHIFATSSHPERAPRGLGELIAVTRVVTVPVVAIGGIQTSNVSVVLAHGASGIAVISAILDAADPGDAARALRQALDAAGGVTS